MILLWGLSGDHPLAAVAAALRRRKAPFVFLDQRDAPVTEVDLEIGETFQGTASTRFQLIDLDSVQAVYIRTYDARTLFTRAEAAEEGARDRAIEAEARLSAWMEITRALVINRPSAMGSNCSKPHQSQLITRHGLRVPATLITTDPDAVGEFLREHGEVVYKSISGVRSIVSRLTPGRLAGIANVAFCPTQFQEYIPGVDYRVHVVGDEVFACEIRSDVDDYRYAARAGAKAEVSAAELPQAVAVAARELTASLGLAVGGIDLRRTPEGEWYWLEVNPSPAFTYYEGETGQPIADAIARALTSSSAPSRKGRGVAFP